jgi:hypothetical protein
MRDLPTREENDAFQAHLDRLLQKADQERLDEWAQFDILMRQAASAPHPYVVHLYVHGVLLVGDISGKVLEGEMYLFWSWMGDWYELNHDVQQKVEAESWMRDAAREWLGLPQENKARQAYVDRWWEKVTLGRTMPPVPRPPSNA